MRDVDFTRVRPLMEELATVSSDFRSQMPSRLCFQSTFSASKRVLKVCKRKFKSNFNRNCRLRPSLERRFSRKPGDCLVVCPISSNIDKVLNRKQFDSTSISRTPSQILYIQTNLLTRPDAALFGLVKSVYAS